jgi:hypothetical protein
MSKLAYALLVAGFGFGINAAAAQIIHFDLKERSAPDEQITPKPVGPNATMELQTRYGRFCIAPPPAFLPSDLAASPPLASRCAMF